MAQPDREVRALLEGRLAAMANRPPIAWENKAFTPPAGLWLRANLIFGAQMPETLFGQGGAAVSDTGAFVVTCYGPQDAGPGAVDALVASVRQWMRPTPPELVGTTCRLLITGTSRGPGLQPDQGQTAHYYVPVTVAFRVWYAL